MSFSPSYGTMTGNESSRNGAVPTNSLLASSTSSNSDNEYDVEKNNGSSENRARNHHIKKISDIIRTNLLVILLILAMVVGITLGAVLRIANLNERQQMYLKFPGDILMNILTLLVLPLIVSSLISGLTSLDTRASGKLGGRAILYYLTSTLVAVILGIIMVMTIRPGERGHIPPSAEKSETIEVEAGDSLLNLVRQMFPSNIVEACFSKSMTVLVKKDLTEKQLNESIAFNKTIDPGYKTIQETSPSMNMLGLVVFSISMGIAINRMGDRGRPLREFIAALCEATLQLVTAAIWYSPIGVAFLVAAQMVEMVDPVQTFEQLGLYCLTVLAGLAIHGFIVLPVLFFVILRKNPYKYIAGILQAMITALGTASSSVTIPITMRNLEENNGVDPRVTSFVIPVGATVNMDGTALYEAVAAIFIAQVNGYPMDVGRVIIICLASTAAAVGAAGVPAAGFVTLVIVLTSAGFPTDDVGMLLAVDWLLDRFRTMVNVMGDAFGAGIVHHFSKADLFKMDEEDLAILVDKGKLSTEKYGTGITQTPNRDRQSPMNTKGGIDNPNYDSSKF